MALIGLLIFGVLFALASSIGSAIGVSLSPIWVFILILIGLVGAIGNTKANKR